MTVQERNQQIETRFRTVREHLTRANPNDFDRQIPPNFVSCDWEHQTITYAFDMEPRFGNPHGMGHGGIVAAMLTAPRAAPSTATAPTIPSSSRCPWQTSIHSQAAGKTLYVKVTLQKVGRTLAYCAAEAWQQSGQLCDHGQGVSSVAKTCRRKANNIFPEKEAFLLPFLHDICSA